MGFHVEQSSVHLPLQHLLTKGILILTVDKHQVWTQDTTTRHMTYHHTIVVFQTLVHKRYLTHSFYQTNCPFPAIGKLGYIDESYLNKRVKIPERAYQPDAPTHLHRLDPTVTMGRVYVKRPRLVHFNALADGHPIAEQFLHEAFTCEHIMRSPHPNLALYLGAEVHNGRLTGLCFERYAESLLNRLSFHDQEYFNQYRPWVTLESFVERASITEQIESGLDHLHSLGLVHNGLAPSRIMFDREVLPNSGMGTAVVKIVGYNGCVAFGTTLSGIHRPVG